MGKKDEMSDDIMSTVSVGSKRSGKRKAVFVFELFKSCPCFSLFQTQLLGSEDEFSFINFFFFFFLASVVFSLAWLKTSLVGAL